MFPILQVSRHGSLMRTLLQQTPRSHVDFRSLSKSLNGMLHFLYYKSSILSAYVHAEFREVESSFRLFDVQEQITGMAPVRSPYVYFLFGCLCFVR